jgi:hypothetical protein
MIAGSLFCVACMRYLAARSFFSKSVEALVILRRSVYQCRVRFFDASLTELFQHLWGVCLDVALKVNDCAPCCGAHKLSIARGQTAE